MTSSLVDLHTAAVDLLTRARVPSPEVDADLLVGYELGLGRGAVRARLITGGTVEDSVAMRIRSTVDRRAGREPLQHITGEAYFRSLTLAVGPGVFVPRPETELLAQLAIDELRASPNSPIGVDLGTGSGAVALAMATEVPRSTVWAVENSPRAFVWARRNQVAVAADNARFVFVDLADALPELDGTVDVVVSNPPYIPTGAIPRDPEVRMFDPEHALYGGGDGLHVVRQVSKTAVRLLRAGGTIAIEHGEDQAGDIAGVLRADGFDGIRTHRDLTGRDRVTSASR